MYIVFTPAFGEFTCDFYNKHWCPKFTYDSIMIYMNLDKKKNDKLDCIDGQKR